MPKTGFGSAIGLTDDDIDSSVKKISPGSYALGRLKTDGTFIVKYVGRSDNNLNERLHDWVGEYDYFKAGYYPTAKQAYEKECTLYHDFGEDRLLDNKVHPACPKNTNWKCPVNGCDFH